MIDCEYKKNVCTVLSANQDMQICRLCFYVTKWIYFRLQLFYFENSQQTSVFCCLISNSLEYCDFLFVVYLTVDVGWKLFFAIYAAKQSRSFEWDPNHGNSSQLKFSSRSNFGEWRLSFLRMVTSDLVLICSVCWWACDDILQEFLSPH